MKKSNNKHKGIWLSVLILFVCSAATTIALMGRLDIFMQSDEGAIPLISVQEIDASEQTSDIAPSADDSDSQATEQDAGQNASPKAEQVTTQTTEQSAETDGKKSAQTEGTAQKTEQKKPGFETYDGANVWSTNTKIEIFRISYENGEYEATVSSDNGDNVIAPGTKNSYTFKLKNTGNVALDYTVSIDAYFTPNDVTMPLTGRLSRHDGKWVVGDQQDYIKVETLNDAEDSATLREGRYCYYTLEWEWPYESGYDSWDTWLGDMAVLQDLTFTIAITTAATESTNPSADIGITPKTGDDSMFAVWIVLAAASLLIIIILILLKFRERKHTWSESTQKENRTQE